MFKCLKEIKSATQKSLFFIVLLTAKLSAMEEPLEVFEKDAILVAFAQVKKEYLTDANFPKNPCLNMLYQKLLVYERNLPALSDEYIWITTLKCEILELLATNESIALLKNVDKRYSIFLSL